MKMKDEDEECIECINAEAALYTLPIEKAYSRFQNYYAPVVFLLSKDTGQPIVFKNAVFIINNPLMLNSYLDNWAKAGIVMPDYNIEIIKSDNEFDRFIDSFIKQGIQVVANPLLNMNQTPLSGLVFGPIDELEKISG